MPVLSAPPAQSPGWPRWVEALAIVSFWTLLGAIALVRRALDPEALFSLHTVAVTAVEYGPWLVLTPAVFWLTRRLPLERKRWAGRLVLHLAIAGIVTLGLGTLHQTVIPALGPPQGVGLLSGPFLERGRPEQDRRPPGPPPPGQSPEGASAQPTGPPLFAPSLHFAF